MARAGITIIIVLKGICVFEPIFDFFGRGGAVEFFPGGEVGERGGHVRVGFRLWSFGCGGAGEVSLGWVCV